MTQTRPHQSPGPDLSVLRMDREPEAPRRRYGWLIALGLLLALALIAFLGRDQLPFLHPEVETTVVTRLTQTEASTVLTATGYTYARTRAAVGSKIIGRLMELRADEGDRVRRGQILAVLDSQDLQASKRRAEASLVEARAQLTNSRREADRRRRLFEEGVGPEADADDAATSLAVDEARVATAQAALDSVEAQLDYTIIRSPIDGVVIERGVEVGEMVAPGGFTSQQSTGAIMRLADPSSLEVEADINESMIARLELGQPAAIRVDAVPDSTFSGRLRQIVPTADRQRAVVQVKVSLDDGDQRLVPDMSCSVTFLEEGTDKAALEAEPTVLIDRGALVRDGANTFVWRVEDGTVSRLAIEIGTESEGQLVSVSSGLLGGEVVVMEPSDDLEDGQQVRVKKP